MAGFVLGCSLNLAFPPKTCLRADVLRTPNKTIVHRYDFSYRSIRYCSCFSCRAPLGEGLGVSKCKERGKHAPGARREGGCLQQAQRGRLGKLLAPRDRGRA